MNIAGHVIFRVKGSVISGNKKTGFEGRPEIQDGLPSLEGL
jgi:hypothetical protein